MIPIYRAKKIDSDEYVEGYYSPTAQFLTKTLKNKNGYIHEADGDWNIIDPSTLAISIDKENWFSIEHSNNILSMKNVIESINQKVTGIQQ